MSEVLFSFGFGHIGRLQQPFARFKTLLFNLVPKSGEHGWQLLHIKRQIDGFKQAGLPQGLNFKPRRLQRVNLGLLFGCGYVFAIDMLCIDGLAKSLKRIFWCSVQFNQFAVNRLQLRGQILQSLR